MRKRRKQKHHLRNKCMGGMNTPDNLLNLWEEKHICWHKLFKNMNLDEIIECLQRVRELQKKKQGGGR